MINDPASSNINSNIKPNTKFVVLSSNFYPEITSLLMEGAFATFHSNSIPIANIASVRVDGVWELALAAKNICISYPNINAIVVLGAVIKGETQHFEYITSSSTSRLHDIMLEHNKPLSLGLITADNYKQAMDRADGTHSNQGKIAVQAAINLLGCVQNIQSK